MTRLRIHQVIWLAMAAWLASCSPEGKQAFNANAKAAVKNADQALQNVGVVANKLANDAKDNVYKTSYQLQKWAVTPPEPPKGPRTIEQSYCYRSLQDILCYRAPMPGAESRLVSYQGTHAEPPPQAVMQLLPTHAYDPSQEPVNRVANARPVFIGLPPDVKADPGAATDAEAPDAAQATPAAPAEIAPQLPNPVLVPQL